MASNGSSPRIDLSALIDKSNQEIFVIDSVSGRFLHANERALRNTGYTLEELTRMTPPDLQQDVNVYDLLERAEALRSGAAEAIEFQTRYRRKDGSSYPVLHHVELIREHDPSVFLVRARALAEGEKPRVVSPIDTEDRYRHMVEDAQEGVWTIDAESKTTYVNSEMASMLGYSREEMAGASLFTFMDDEGKQIADANVERRRQGVSERHDFKFIRKDGSELWTIIAARPQFDEDARYAGAFAIVTDITERKQCERALAASLDLPNAEDIFHPDESKSLLSSQRMPAVTGLRASRVARRFSVLADSRRLELVELLARGDERPVGALADALGMSQSNVSKHLKILAEAGLVSRRPHGAKTFYALSDPTVAMVCRLVCHWLGNQAQAEYEALAS